MISASSLKSFLRGIFFRLGDTLFVFVGEHCFRVICVIRTNPRFRDRSHEFHQRQAKKEAANPSRLGWSVRKRFHNLAKPDIFYLGCVRFWDRRVLPS